jgi:glucose uptake protein GlcU
VKRETGLTVKKVTRKKITAMDRKVNKPRLGLRRGLVILSNVEKCVITTVFGLSNTKGLNKLTPGSLGMVFGTFYSPTGYKHMPEKSRKNMVDYMKKNNIKVWFQE